MTEPITMTPIGYVVTGYAAVTDVPSQATENFGEPGRVEVLERYAGGLDGLAAHRYAWLLTWLHAQSDEDASHLRVVPRSLEGTGQTRGVFATRSPNRVNRLGLSLVHIVGIEGNVVHFTGVDLVGGTPVLDIKPWWRDTDTPPDA